MKTSDSVWIAWQEPESKNWIVVGKLTQLGGFFEFNYTKGAKRAKSFQPFNGMEDLSQPYYSIDLFPLFKNRVLSSKRPEYPKLLHWLDLNEKEATPITILGRSGGLRSTDNIQIFYPIQLDAENRFVHYFFVHGLNYLSESAKTRIDQLRPGDKLLLCIDGQNEHDKNAVVIRADSPAEFIGYCPRYLAAGVKSILKNRDSKISIEVKKTSTDAPSNYRLLCKMFGQTTKQIADKYTNRQEFQTISGN